VTGKVSAQVREGRANEGDHTSDAGLLDYFMRRSNNDLLLVLSGSTNTQARLRVTVEASPESWCGALLRVVLGLGLWPVGANASRSRVQSAARKLMAVLSRRRHDDSNSGRVWRFLCARPQQLARPTHGRTDPQHCLLPGPLREISSEKKTKKSLAENSLSSRVCSWTVTWKNVPLSDRDVTRAPMGA